MPNTPILGEICMAAFNFAPRGYALCDGQLLPINQNQALFSLLGTTYGGDGRTTFALPDLRGRVPLHPGTLPDGSTMYPGEKGGSLNVTILPEHLPSHTHTLACVSGPGNSETPAGNAWAADGAKGTTIYSAGPPNALGNVTTPSTGSSGPHTNVQPYLVINFFIALQGIFPSRP